jgi:hypothetical protein
MQNYEGMTNQQLNIEVAKRHGYYVAAGAFNSTEGYFLFDELGVPTHAHAERDEGLCWLRNTPNVTDDANLALALIVDTDYTIDHLTHIGFTVKFDDLPQHLTPAGTAKTLPKAITIAWLTWQDEKGSDDDQ